MQAFLAAHFTRWALRWVRDHLVLAFIFGGAGTTITGGVLLVCLMSFVDTQTIFPTAGGGAPSTVDATQAATVTGIPLRAMQALLAVEAVSKERTGCHVPWWVLAGISLNESGHGTHGNASIGPDFEVTPTIGGPPLDGNGYALIFEAGEITFAVGPFQFIPGSWRAYGLDMNGDGVNDPNNYLDAALSAANHLCGSAGGHVDLANEVDARRGIFGYNHSDDYVERVWTDGSRYRQQAGDQPGVVASPVVAVTPGPAGQFVPVSHCNRPAGCLLDAAWAPYAEAFLAAADAAGFPMVVNSAYRSDDEQKVLRRQNCGPTDYDIYIKAPGDCDVVTARPGESNHRLGKAMDVGRAGSGAGLSGPGDPYWEWAMANGDRYNVHQNDSLKRSDTVHLSETGG